MPKCSWKKKLNEIKVALTLELFSPSFIIIIDLGCREYNNDIYRYILNSVKKSYMVILNKIKWILAISLVHLLQTLLTYSIK